MLLLSPGRGQRARAVERARRGRGTRPELGGGGGGYFVNIRCEN